MKSLKPSSKLPSRRETRENIRQDNMMRNPNVSNWAGSTDVTWNGDQATITQTLNPALQGIADQQVSFLQGGPQQLGNYQNNTISNLFESFANRVGDRAGLGMSFGGLNQPQPMMKQPYGYEKPAPVEMAQPAQQLPQQASQGMPVSGLGGFGFRDQNQLNNWLSQFTNISPR